MYVVISRYIRNTLLRGNNLCVIALSLLVISVIPNNAFARTEYYVSPNGSNSNSGLTKGESWGTINYASKNMGGGNTLIIMDGIYLGRENMLEPPSGNGPDEENDYTIIKAENDGKVTIDGNGSLRDWEGESEVRIGGWGSYGGREYITVEGLKVRAGGTHGIFIWGSKYIKIKRVGIILKGRNSKDNHGVGIEHDSRYILVEDSWAAGGMRAGFMLHGGGEVIFRRCVVRMDYNTISNPTAGFMTYSAGPNVQMQNCIAIDVNPEGQMGISPNLYYGGYERLNSGGSIKFYGSIALKVKSGSGYGDGFISVFKSDGVGSRDNDMINCVSWDNRSGYSHKGDEGSLVNHVTFSGGLRTWGSVPGAPGAGLTLTNSWFADGNANGINIVDNNHFTNPSDSSGTNATTGNKELLQYLPIAPVVGGESKGATILYRYGRPGTLWGDAGFDELTTEPLWPWPNEDRIKSDFSEPNDPVSGGSVYPKNNDTKRGFCSDKASTTPGNADFIGGTLYGGNRTLTSYIWEYLGNPCPHDALSPLGSPDNICGEPPVDNSPPGTINITGSKASGGEIVFEWTNPNDFDYAGVLIKYNTGNAFPLTHTQGSLAGDISGNGGSSGTFTHSNLVNGETYSYSFFSYDKNGNYSDAVNQSVTLSASDTVPPYISGLTPTHKAEAVLNDAKIVFNISDDWGDVVKNSIAVKLMVGTSELLGSLDVSGISNNYAVTFTPSALLPYAERVDVTINAEDNSGNIMNHSSYFITSEKKFSVTLGPTSVSKSSDDGYSYDEDNTHFTFIRFGQPNGLNYRASFIFRDLKISKKANILSAYLMFYPISYENDSVVLDLTIKGIAPASQDTFSKGNMGQHRTLIDSVPVNWKTKQDWPHGVEQRSSDVKDIVQAIVDDPNWDSSDAMGFYISNALGSSGSKRHTMYSFDSGKTEYFPRLVITYGGQIPPQKDITPPVGTAELKGIIIGNNGEKYITNPIEILLKATDVGGYVVEWLASESNLTPLAGDQRWIVEGKNADFASGLLREFTLSGSSAKEIYIWTKDDSANISKPFTLPLAKLDVTPPEVVAPLSMVSGF